MCRDDWINPAAQMLAVRGPLTRLRALECGASCPEIYGDPALLLPRFYSPRAAARVRLGVVPHYFDKPRIAAHWRPPQGCALIDIQQGIERVIDEIACCDRILSSSLHGLIVAHAYGVPAMWVKFGDTLLGDGSKFRDYLGSVGQTIAEPIRLDNQVSAAESLLSQIPPAPREIDTDALWAVCPFRSDR
jgi:hypothetical protein